MPIFTETTYYTPPKTTATASTTSPVNNISYSTVCRSSSVFVLVGRINTSISSM